MPGFDYGNARLRTMRSRLLSRREMELLSEAGTLKGFIAGLTKTAYRKAVEAALAHASGMESISQALREDLSDTLGVVRRFYLEEAGENVALILLAYDIQNLKAVLRGLARNLSARDILSALIPIGMIEYAAFANLAHAPHPRAAVDLLATMGVPLAQPLVELRTEQPGAEVSRMELALDQWMFQQARKFLQETSQQRSVLASAFDLEADLTNLLTVLRFAHAPHERKLLHEWLGREDLELAFVTPGRIPVVMLIEAGSQDTLEAAVNALAETPFGPYLRAGMDSFRQSGRLSDLEKRIRYFRLTWLSQQIARDPLGIGVVLGYFSEKVNEIGNLRWIAQGINLGLDSNAIRSELVLLS
jgi:V/A-type H+/Na+-transporting ATPase subunit C